MKTETKHTKGEWKLNEDDRHIINLPNGIDIEVIYWNSQNEEAMYDAQLIAAAPDMLESLKEALDQLESWNQESEDTFTMKRVREAIRKAIE